MTGSQPDEYAIDASLFRQTLLSQRASRQKGGLYHLNQILMAYNTNRIEGSQLDEEQTRYIYETRTIFTDEDTPAVRVDDVMETVNSFELFDAVLDGLDEPITAQTMKNYHQTLKRGTADANRPSFAVRDWKRHANVVGNQRTVPPEKVELAVAEMLDVTPQRMSFTDIADFHYRFESIHPFQDGNGRVGRALMFQQCLQNNIMPFIVLDGRKAFYYRGLREYEEKPGFLLDTFRQLQDDYYARFADFVETL
ncbi:Fic family protein [Leucobacter denitrificans]|uniref:Fic family protein n=2 Tax=Leucobacter denitrificans TaxID=683042 RepID=A0A7G9S7U9_9MICO|nr:Fic family protein [Leucobacter denitrificans]